MIGSGIGSDIIIPGAGGNCCIMLGGSEFCYAIRGRKLIILDS